jgi:hypothetical protein
LATARLTWNSLVRLRIVARNVQVLSCDVLQPQEGTVSISCRRTVSLKIIDHLKTLLNIGSTKCDVVSGCEDCRSGENSSLVVGGLRNMYNSESGMEKARSFQCCPETSVTTNLRCVE